LNKRYQVFLSSTYKDLSKGRSIVTQTLINMDCIPVGMESFPAADEEQWGYIKKIIDICDYYILIIGGKYGSIAPDGISYTEKEYDYAVSKGIKVLAFLHEKPELLPESKKENDPKMKELLEKFRQKVSNPRLVKFWKKPEELQGLVAVSLIKEINDFPAVGWVRADTVSNEQLLTDLNDLRKENSDLRGRLSKLEPSSDINIENLASLEEEVELEGEVFDLYYKHYKSKNILKSWREIFKEISPFIMNLPNEMSIQFKIGEEIFNGRIKDQSFQTIKIQLLALNLINAQYKSTTQGGMAWFWNLTPLGKKVMFELRSIKSKPKK